MREACEELVALELEELVGSDARHRHWGRRHARFVGRGGSQVFRRAVGGRRRRQAHQKCRKAAAARTASGDATGAPWHTGSNRRISGGRLVRQMSRSLFIWDRLLLVYTDSVALYIERAGETFQKYLFSKTLLISEPNRIRIYTLLCIGYIEGVPPNALLHEFHYQIVCATSCKNETRPEGARGPRGQKATLKSLHVV